MVPWYMFDHKAYNKYGCKRYPIPISARLQEPPKPPKKKSLIPVYSIKGSGGVKEEKAIREKTPPSDLRDACRYSVSQWSMM